MSEHNETENPKTQLGFMEKGLVQQGFEGYTPQELKALEWGLRFTPSMCMIFTIWGLVANIPEMVLAMAAFGVLSFFAPTGHPFDILYNLVVRHFHKGVKLPAAPLQRRLACFAGGLTNVISGLFLVYDLPVYAYIAGSILVALQLLVIVSHFCVLSWAYELILKANGKWEEPIEPYMAERLVKQGVLLVDVREPTEFSRKHVKGALNIPLEALKKNVSALHDKPVMLYCSSGTRSNLAKKVLQKNGHGKVYDLGSMSRIDYILGTE